MKSPHYQDGKFRNTSGIGPNYSRLGSIIKRSIFEKRIATPPNGIPLVPMSVESLSEQPQPTIYRLGHSTVLIHDNDEYWLTDPVFSQRASLVQWAGPERFHQPPISIEDLPAIKGVVISHNHYDHLDKNALKALHHKVEHFYVPLGVEEALTDWGVPAEKITSLDWWQSVNVGNVELVATPSQHFSGRGLTDSNQTLWASWVILMPNARLFFSGDTGYFDGFKAIGEKYGPFDLTMMETGAYDKDWIGIHMLPEQSLQAHRDLKGRTFMPIHNGTFDLGLHDWNDPYRQVMELAGDTTVTIPKMGQAVPVHTPPPLEVWWEQGSEVSENKVVKTGAADNIATAPFSADTAAAVDR